MNNSPPCHTLTALAAGARATLVTSPSASSLPRIPSRRTFFSSVRCGESCRGRIIVLTFFSCFFSWPSFHRRIESHRCQPAKTLDISQGCAFGCPRAKVVCSLCAYIRLNPLLNLRVGSNLCPAALTFTSSLHLVAPQSVVTPPKLLAHPQEELVFRSIPGPVLKPSSTWLTRSKAPPLPCRPIHPWLLVSSRIMMLLLQQPLLRPTTVDPTCQSLSAPQTLGPQIPRSRSAAPLLLVRSPSGRRDPLCDHRDFPNQLPYAPCPDLHMPSLDRQYAG
jgi:hypothetical protein